MYNIPVFIDTSIFVSENYFRGIKLKSLLKLSHEGKIQIFLVDITEREIRKKMEDEIIATRIIIKKFIGDINSTGRIIKNLEEFEKIWGIERPTLDEFSIPLNQKLDELIKEHKINIIPSSIASIEEVFDDYFNNRLPFQTGDKKNEFPDAFIFNAILKWCEQNEVISYLLTYDNDFLKIESETVITTTLPKYLELIALHEKGVEERISYIHEFIYENESSIFEKIKSEFEDEIGYEINEKINRFSVYQDSDYDKIRFKELEIEDITTITFNDADVDELGIISLEISAKVKVKIDINYNDYDFASYDKEDDIWFGVERKSKTLTTKLEIKFQADVEFEVEDGTIINEEIEDVCELEIISIDLGDESYH
jgi:hypothetical protein